MHGPEGAEAGVIATTSAGAGKGGADREGEDMSSKRAALDAPVGGASGGPGAPVGGVPGATLDAPVGGASGGPGAPHWGVPGAALDAPVGGASGGPGAPVEGGTWGVT